MPGLDSRVSLTWPDYASVYVQRKTGEEEEREGGGGEDWAIVYHSLDNHTDTHMVAQQQFKEVRRAVWVDKLKCMQTATSSPGFPAFLAAITKPGDEITNHANSH